MILRPKQKLHIIIFIYFLIVCGWGQYIEGEKNIKSQLYFVKYKTKPDIQQEKIKHNAII